MKKEMCRNCMKNEADDEMTVTCSDCRYEIFRAMHPNGIPKLNLVWEEGKLTKKHK